MTESQLATGTLLAKNIEKVKAEFNTFRFFLEDQEANKDVDLSICKSYSGFIDVPAEIKFELFEIINKYYLEKEKNLTEQFENL
jgi:hypothetical protein